VSKRWSMQRSSARLGQLCMHVVACHCACGWCAWLDPSSLPANGSRHSLVPPPLLPRLLTPRPSRQAAGPPNPVGDRAPSLNMPRPGTDQEAHHLNSALTGCGLRFGLV
jgi:hypothetical protein